MKKSIFFAFVALFMFSGLGLSAQIISTSYSTSTPEVTEKVQKPIVQRKIRKNTISASYTFCDVYLYQRDYYLNGLSLAYTRVIPFDRRGITFMDLGLGINYAAGIYDDSWENVYDEPATLFAATVPLNLGLCLRIGRLFYWSFYAGISGTYYYSDFDALYLGWQAGSKINVGLVGIGFEYGSSITEIYDGGWGETLSLTLGFNF